MSAFKDSEHSSTSSPAAVQMQAQLDLRLFHLQTLYDVSRQLLGEIEVESILKNFLLMTLGNFGTAEGFILIYEPNAKEPNLLVSFGIQDNFRSLLIKESNRMLDEHPRNNAILGEVELRHFSFLQPPPACALTFYVDEGLSGLLGLGSKIVDKPYGEDDKNLLETLLNNLVVSLKNARSTQALKQAYEEVTILNRAKDKLINHLSHELQTPVALLMTSLKMLKNHLAPIPKHKWQRIMERAGRSLQRLLDMQIEVEDIVQKAGVRNRDIISRLLEQCADELEVLIAEQGGDEAIVEKIRNRIDEIYGLKDVVFEDIAADRFVKAQIEKIKPRLAHRQLELKLESETTPPIRIPSDPLEKLVVGLIKNAVENTPDEGKIEIAVRNIAERGVEFVVHDAGVGIVEELRKRIFEGFFPTQETIDYSSKRPFDFNAGGKGADLLRLKIFSERFDFKLDMTSTRCRHIPLHTDACPGKISQCRFCRTSEDCYTSGGTRFIATFKAAET